jgi:hypothetical protein
MPLCLKNGRARCANAPGILLFIVKRAARQFGEIAGRPTVFIDEHALAQEGSRYTLSSRRGWPVAISRPTLFSITR